MLLETRKQKLLKRINKILEKYRISEDITYSIQEKNNIYQCVISYKQNSIWKLFWVSTGINANFENLQNANICADEITSIFIDTIRNYNTVHHFTNLPDIDSYSQYNTTNLNPNKTTKADWDFYDLMFFWLTKIIIYKVEPSTYKIYQGQVTGRLKQYFTNKKNRRLVKTLSSDDLDEFYDYLRENGLSNSTIDHYNDNISSAFKYLLKKRIVLYNPTDYIDPITVEVKEVSTYNVSEILKLLKILEGDIIEIPTLFNSFYGLRRSEIIGLRKEAFDFENNTFIINHVAITNYGKDTKEKVYFVDRTKSKKGCRTFPIISELKTAVLERIEQIETNKKLFGNTYNYKYDDYLFVHDNGDIINPNYVTKRFKKIIDRNKLKKITPHGLRHSIATLLHIAGVDIRDLQDWLGHESITSTNRYARSDYKKQVSTSKVVLEIFNKEDNRKRFKIKRKKNIYATS